MRIKIIEVGNVAKEKSYFAFTLKYESDGKTQDKKIFSFNGDTYKTLKDAQPDQVYDVKLTKDNNGYWQWKDLALVTNQAAASGGGNASTSTSRFETPEERANRQVLIVRQNALTNAVTYYNVEGKQVDSDAVLELAAKFESWVMRD